MTKRRQTKVDSGDETEGENNSAHKQGEDTAGASAIDNTASVFAKNQQRKSSAKLTSSDTKVDVQKKENRSRSGKFAANNKEFDRIEAELEVTRQRLLFHVANTPLGYIEWGREGFIKYKSPRAEEIFGWTLNEFLDGHLTAFDQVYAEDLPLVNQTVNQLLSGEVERNKVQHRCVTKDGRVIWCEWFNSGWKDKHGDVIAIMSLVQDITEQKNAEIAKDFEIIEKEALINSTDDLIWSVSHDMKLVAANKAFYQTVKAATGIEMHPGTDLLANNVFPGELITFWEKNYRRSLSGASIKEELYTPALNKQEAAWTETAFNPIFNKDRIIGVACYTRDITERKLAIEKIRQSEARLAEAQAMANVGNWETDLSTMKVSWSAEALKILGIHPETAPTSYQNIAIFCHPDDAETVNAAFVASFGNRAANTIEHRIINPTGDVKFVEKRWYTVGDEAGKPLRAVGTIQDITERKLAAQIISERESKYRSFFENSMDGILLTVADGRILAANPAACEIFKMTEEEICNKGRYGLIDTSDPRAEALIRERQLTGKARGELTFLRKDGSKFPGEISSMLFIDHFGQQRTSMIVRDISERKITEGNLTDASVALKIASTNLEKIMESSLDIICTVDVEGRFVTASAAVGKILGYEPFELIGQLFIDFVFSEDVEKTIQIASSVMEGQPITMFENRYIKKDGSTVPLLWSASWDENDKIMCCIAKDATEKQRLEKAFEIERLRFFDLFQKAPTSIGITKGANHAYEMVNPLYLELIGKQDIIGKTVIEVLPEMKEQGIIDLLDHVYETGEPFLSNERLVKFDPAGNGEFIDKYLNFIYQAYRNASGNIEGIFFFAVDATEQVISRNKIEESEREIRTMAESMPQIVWVADPAGDNTYLNQQWVDYTGLTVEESYGRGWLIPFHAEDRMMAAEAWIYAISTMSEYSLECRLKCHDGSYRWWLIRGVPKINDKQEILKWYGTCTDIEQIKQTEEKLKKQAADLTKSNAELEQFAYVASHDMQEPLRTVTSFLTLLEKRYEDILDEKGKKYIGFAVDGSKRMQRVIQDLLEFSKVGRTDEYLEEINLNELVKEIQVSFQKQINEKKATIHVGELPFISAYRTPIRQVFQNLISNALKYSKQEGVVEIQVSAIPLKDCWQFSVKDTGIGIDAEYFDKIFVIFQRLHHREEFSGTGIGLPVTKKIIEEMGGKIWLTSKPGEGSTFHFTIPKT